VDRPLILESTFLIDLEREHNRGTPARAVAFLEANPRASFYLPFVVPGELAAGVPMAHRPRLEALLAPFYVLPHTPDVSWEFGRTLRHLRNTGQLIGTNDMWIAATALAYEMALVTRDVERFQRVPDLEVEGY
jgi:predicted nucleic acid-binding protein